MDIQETLDILIGLELGVIENKSLRTVAIDMMESYDETVYKENFIETNGNNILHLHRLILKSQPDIFMDKYEKSLAIADEAVKDHKVKELADEMNAEIKETFEEDDVSKPLEAHPEKHPPLKFEKELKSKEQLETESDKYNKETLKDPELKGDMDTFGEVLNKEVNEDISTFGTNLKKSPKKAKIQIPTQSLDDQLQIKPKPKEAQ